MAKIDLTDEEKAAILESLKESVAAWSSESGQAERNYVATLRSIIERLEN